MPKKFEDKVVIVTGSSSGIGRATALAFAIHGASVVVHGRSEQRLKETVAALLDAGIDSSKFLVVRGDTGDEETLKSIVDKTVQRFGRIDILVNNAAVNLKSNSDSQSIENLDYIFKINFRSVVILTKIALPHLMESNGCIVNVSSTGSLKVYEDMEYYCAMKAALDHYSRALAIRCAPKVRVNSVLPGAVKTNIMWSAGLSEAEGHKLCDQYAEHAQLIKRAGEPEDVAHVILFLADSASNLITGTEFVVDGGDTVHRHQSSFWQSKI